MLGERSAGSALVLVAAVCALGCGDTAAPGKKSATCDAGEGEGEGVLYPMEAGAWWRYRVTASATGVRSEKVVEITEQGPIPGRESIDGYMAYSQRVDGYGHRWQSIDEDTGDVLRHVDEWFDLDGTRTMVEHFCPFKYRVPDPGSMTDVDAEGNPQLTENWVELQILPPDQDDWDLCETLEINPEDCTVMNGPAPDVCGLAYTPDPEADDEEFQTKAWRSLGETEYTVPARAEPYLAFEIQNTATTDEDGEIDYEDPKTFSFARGVGKVYEDDPGTEWEELLECCLPSAGCNRPAPD